MKGLILLKDTVNGAIGVVFLFLCLPLCANNIEESSLAEVRRISKDIQGLKQEVISLNKDLKLMEETLLFPSSTRFSIFVSVSSGRFFTLESIKLKIDDEVVSSHVYSDKQRQALIRGGVQKLHMMNLNSGKHKATVFFTGVGPNGRDYKRAIDLDFEKGPGSGHMELVVTDDGAIQEPIFRIKQW